MPDKPLKMTLENGAVASNFVYVTDSAVPYTSENDEMAMLI